MIDEMIIFSKLAELQNYSKTAKILNLPKSTISRKIKRLEEHLGVLLIQRTSRTFNLTEIGNEYYKRSLEIIRSMEELDNFMINSKNEPEGNLRITIPLDTANYFLKETMKKYSEKYPQVNIEIHFSTEVVNLAAENFDLGIRIGEFEDSSVIIKKINKIGTNIYASKEYIDKYGEPLSIEDLKLHNCIKINSLNNPDVWTLYNKNKKVDLKINSNLSVGSSSFAYNMCVIGLGIGLLPDYLIRNDQGNLIHILKDWKGKTRNVYVAFPSRRSLTPKVRKFIEVLEENFQV